MLKFEAVCRDGMLVPTGPMPVAEGQTVQLEVVGSVVAASQPVPLMPGERDYNDDEDERPWRGVLVMDAPCWGTNQRVYPPLPLDKIPRGEVEINFAWHRIHADEGDE